MHLTLHHSSGDIVENNCWNESEERNELTSVCSHFAKSRFWCFTSSRESGSTILACSKHQCHIVGIQLRFRVGDNVRRFFSSGFSGYSASDDNARAEGESLTEHFTCEKEDADIYDVRGHIVSPTLFAS